MEKRIAIYAGSFDPLTNGHMWMIEEGSKLFDELIVVVAVNAQKKCTFSAAERIRITLHSSQHLRNVRVEVVENSYIVDYAKSVGASFLLRGIRGPNDYEYEHALRHINSRLKPEVATVFLMPPKEMMEISSSMVKNLVGPEGWQIAISHFLPEAAFKAVLKKYGGAKSYLWYEWQKFSPVGHIDYFKVADQWYNKLVDLYSENQRTYHTLDHIASCLEEFNDYEQTNKSVRERSLLLVALWFHDVVYDPRRNDNEERSVELAKEFLRAVHWLDGQYFSERLAGLILATKHKEIPEDKDTQVLLDIDLTILGKPEAEFDAYEAAIRKEYEWVPEADFKKGRAEILEQFLKRPTIYSTDYFREKYEKQARENLKRSIAKCRS